eukprot:2317949-Prymnesium_polylepis.1
MRRAPSRHRPSSLRPTQSTPHTGLRAPVRCRIALACSSLGVDPRTIRARRQEAWRWVGFEVELHGISVALIDSVPTAPRELLQLNLRGIRVELVRSQEIGMRCAFTLRSLSIDNLLPDNFNPVLLDATLHADESGAGGDKGPPTEEVEVARHDQPCLAVALDRRDQFTYRKIAVHSAPVRVVLDLSLLKALSIMGSQGGTDRRSLEIDCSPRLRATFHDLRGHGISLPPEVIRLEEANSVYSARRATQTLSPTRSLTPTLTLSPT